MTQRWFQKASVQVAMVTTFGTVTIAIMTIAYQRSELRQNVKNLNKENSRLEAVLDDTKHERDKYQIQLAPFFAVADKNFPNLEKDKRIDHLIDLVERIGADLEKSLPLQLTQENRKHINDIIKQAVQDEEGTDNPPSIKLIKFPGQTSDSAEFLDTLQTTFDMAKRKAETTLNLGVKGTKTDGSGSWGGVIIGVNDLDNPPLIAQRIYNMTQSIGLQTWMIESQGHGPNTVVILAHRLSDGISKEN